MGNPVKSIEVPITYLELRLLLSVGSSELSECVALNLIGEAANTSELHTDKGPITETEEALINTTIAKVIYLFNQFSGKEYINIAIDRQKLYLIMR